MYKLIYYFIFSFLIITIPTKTAIPSEKNVVVKVGPLIIKKITNKKFIKNRLFIDIDYELDKSVHDGNTLVMIKEVVGDYDDRLDFGYVVILSKTPGTIHKNFVVQRHPNRNAAHKSKKIKVVVVDSQFKPKLKESAIIDFPIDWPEYLPYAGDENDKIFKEAQKIIDNYGRFSWADKIQMAAAKNKLETILNRSPGYVAAYIELARYHMKTGKFSESLGQSERLLKAALAENDKYADTYVLLGYVYTHQKKYKQANNTFERAQKIGTNNLWLYVNHGELYEKMGNKKGAILEYKKAISKKRKNDRNDLPLEAAYNKLIRLYKEDIDKNVNNWDLVNALHTKKVKVFPGMSCNYISYANDLILYSTDYDKALKQAKKAKRLQCLWHEKVETVLVLSHIMKWYDLLEKDKKQAERHYHQGLIRLKNMAALITTLAYTKKTQAVLKKLVEIKHINLDAKWTDDTTALVKYVQTGNKGAVIVLLRLGANPNTTHFAYKITPVMLAVMQKDLSILEQLLNYGGDRNLKDKQGNTALDYAKKINRKDAIHILMKDGSV